MNELQQCEFELLKVFTEICDQLQLRYFLVCGTALGAVKYQGFIPWDDDVDVALLREDYEVFIREAPRLLPEHIFLQNHQTERQSPIIFSKLRNSNTTYIEKTAAKLPVHHGVYIDIFPLDGYPVKKAAARRFELKKLLYSKILVALYIQPTRFKTLLAMPLRLLGVRKWYPYITDRYIALIKKYPCEGSALLCNHGNWQGKLEYAPREQYGDGTTPSFEGLRVTVPENYDAYLTQKYGDWRADLPESERVGHHYFAVCDLEKPYTYYIN